MSNKPAPLISVNVISTTGTKLALYLISILFIPKPSNTPLLSVGPNPPMLVQLVVAKLFCGLGSNLPSGLYFILVEMKSTESSTPFSMVVPSPTLFNPPYINLLLGVAVNLT